MKKLLLIFLLTLNIIYTNGQTWAPIGAKWIFGIGQVWSTDYYYNVWTSTKDTLVGGHTCKLIKRYGPAVTSDISKEFIMYEDSNIVYWYNTVINQFTTMYDFNKNTGDTWTMKIDSCNLIITVDSTGIETLNNFQLKVLYISSEDYSFNGKVIQNIGHLLMPNPDILFHCYGIVVDGTYYMGLRCYEDSIFGFHDFNIAPSCYYTSVGINEFEKSSGFSIFPNPADEFININTKLNGDINYKINNFLGQQEKSGIIRQNFLSISLENLKEGIYSIEFFSDKTHERKSFIIVR